MASVQQCGTCGATNTLALVVISDEQWAALLAQLKTLDLGAATAATLKAALSTPGGKRIYSNPPVTGVNMPPYPGTPTLPGEWWEDCYLKTQAAAKSADDQARAIATSAIADVIAQVKAGKTVDSVTLSVSREVRLAAVAEVEP